MLQYTITFHLTVPFLLPEQHIELSPRQICCKTSSFKDAQDPNTLKVQYLHDLPLPKEPDILILCKVTKSKGIPDTQISLLIISYTRASRISQAAENGRFRSQFLPLYRLLEPRLSSLFSARLYSPPPPNPRCFPTTLRPLPSAPRAARTAAPARLRIRRGGKEAAAPP